MTDEQLIGYAQLHCQTDLKLFSVGHIKRLFELAGEPVPEVCTRYPKAFRSMDEETVEALVKKIRARQKGDER